MCSSKCSSSEPGFVYLFRVSEGLTPDIQGPTSHNLSQLPVSQIAFVSQPQPHMPRGDSFGSLSH